MSEQLSLGGLLRDRGMASVMAHTDTDWKRAAEDAIADLARAGEPFTSEDLRAIVGDPPHHPNAMGSIFRTAAYQGLISRCGSRKAQRPGMHATELPLWIGKIKTEETISPVAPRGGL